MNLGKEIIQDELESAKMLGTLENSLEELSLQFIYILKDYKDKGLIGEKEYENHIKIKENFLNYLNKKRGISTL
ncbi:hypothetical protein KQI88_04115 [Alkaliphilus sp. MSJ-5]|uniref:Uncharacterized protein n=1 Tax=Alkaliphilus flagellatus TaxID=2841507 RepID=A0ABS6FZB5_9FIRM|nr:hypothetical protein [Alkaliphilus flagellatus]MBU5675595.1 hypothetical protein [Alkaliphilus flagellatus]